MRKVLTNVERSLWKTCSGRTLFTAVGVITFFSLISTASATPIGKVDVANCPINTAGVQVTATSITWLPNVNPPGGVGCIATGGANFITYSGGTLGGGDTTGQIKNLVIGGGTVPNFIIFTDKPGLSFSLTGLGPTQVGVAQGTANTNCASTVGNPGVSCSAPGSPFVLTDEFNGAQESTNVTVRLAGGATDGVTPDSTWGGTWTSQFSGLSPVQILAGIGGATETVAGQVVCSGGACTDTYSGDLTLTAGSTVPEPVTFVVIGVGLIGIAMLKRRKARV